LSAQQAVTSLRQIEANRRNATNSTGPLTNPGKQRSRCNAVRHGLTAETVIQPLEDAEDYKAFELSVTAGFDARTAVERELVLRLAGLLWRLRRATAIETGLLQIHSCNEGPVEQDGARFGQSTKGTVVRMRELEPTVGLQGDHKIKAAQLGINAEIAARFLALNCADGGAFERLNRYETALWRQVGQLLVTLEFMRRYQPV
jgi:hypothetical protein